MSPKKTVVISDIHIGRNEATNWYQKDIHEPYLAYILEWILNNRAEVDELIVLGDFFDFWTCPPDEKPPTVAQIVAANPNILGAKGLVSEVLSALEGRVSYLHGNHDITTTQADLNEIKNPKYTIKLQPDIYVRNNVVYTHGHLFTMFNAPDPNQPIPAGHFVTRAVSYYLKQKKEQAAQEPGFGVPNMGFGGLKTVLDKLSFPGILTHLHDILDFSMTREFLTIIQNTTGIPDDEPIVLEGNLGTTTFAQVKVNYENLWSDWMHRYNAGQGFIRGFMYAYKSAWADYDGSYLGWFAQQLAFQYVADLVVMGHTHIPRAGLEGDIANYLNGGFECVPVPDMDSEKITYSIVTTENGRPVASEVLAITQQGSQYQSSNDNPPKASVLGDLAHDYSCYITVENKSDEKYTLVPGSIENSFGYFVVIPPNEIPAKSIIKFWIQDSPGPSGSSGKVKYCGQTSGHNVEFYFECPSLNLLLFNHNSCGGTNEYYTKSGSIHNSWGAKNEVEKEGHPFFVKFAIN